MSNHLALATVTAALAQQLQMAFNDDDPPVSGAEVTMRTPRETGMPSRGANVFLYQVTPNAALRNADLPTRGSNSQLARRPTAAVDVHYLLTFYGNEAELEAQRLLGSAVRALHARPVLTREGISATITANAFLGESDLADSIELVKFSPIALTLEELSKLWSVFFQVPYTLSVAYQGTLVLIETDETPRRPLPVRERTVTALPMRTPAIESIEPDRAVTGATLTVRGRNLAGEVTRMRFGDVLATPSNVSGSRITVELPAALRAGVRGVQIVHELNLGRPPTPHRGFESNVAPFVLQPAIAGTEADVTDGQGEVTVTFDPPVAAGQRVSLLLNEISNGDEKRASDTFFAERPESETNKIVFAVTNVKSAEYLVRVQVDGATSPLEVKPDPANPSQPDPDDPRYIGPTITIPAP